MRGCLVFLPASAHTQCYTCCRQLIIVPSATAQEHPLEAIFRLRRSFETPRPSDWCKHLHVRASSKSTSLQRTRSCPHLTRVHNIAFTLFHAVCTFTRMVQNRSFAALHNIVVELCPHMFNDSLKHYAPWQLCCGRSVTAGTRLELTSAPLQLAEKLMPGVQVHMLLECRWNRIWRRTCAMSRRGMSWQWCRGSKHLTNSALRYRSRIQRSRIQTNRQESRTASVRSLPRYLDI